MQQPQILFHGHNQVAADLYTFKTTRVGSTSISITVSSGTVNIAWGDGNVTSGVGTGTHSNTYAGAGTKNIYITGSVANITSLTFSSSSVSDVSISALTGLTSLTLSGNTFSSINLSAQTALTTLDIRNNTSLTSVTNPVSTSNWVSYRIHGCTALTSLNLSNLGSYFGADFYAYDCTSLTSITYPSTSRVFTNFWVYNTAIVSMNLSNLTGFGGNVRLYNNTSMTSFTAPVSSQSFVLFWMYGCTNSGFNSLDLSNLSGLSGGLVFNGNTHLSSITFPSVSSGIITSLYLYGTALTSLDLSTLSGLGGDIRFYSITTLTSVSFPTSTQVITFLWAYGCTSLTSFDFTGLSKLGGDVKIWGCSSVTSITFPTSTQSFSSLWFFGLSASFTDADLSGLSGLAGCSLACYSNTGMTNITLSTSISGQINNITAYNGNLSTITNLDQCSVDTLDIYNNSMTQGECDTIINDIYTNAASYTGTPSVNMAGTNASPSGTYANVCPPTTPKEKVYNLVNNNCSTGFVPFTFTIS